MARLWRAFHDGTPPRGGERLELSPAESHHVRRVLRLRAGEPLTIFDGSGREWRATLLEPRGERAEVAVGAEVGGAVEPALDVHLYQGLCRPALLEWVIQKATEIGVAAISPLETERAERARPRAERLRRVAVEACKQSGRRRLPRTEFCTEPPPAPDSILALVLDPGARERPLAGYLGTPVPDAVWLLSGPEAGLSSQEVERWERQGWRRASLGPRTLRAETAGVVGVSIVLHHWGDLGRAAGDGPAGRGERGERWPSSDPRP